jgi:hypothetical protein
MGTLSRDEMLSRMSEMPREPIEIAELGGEVYIRVMMLREVRELNRIIDANPNNNIAVYPKALLYGCCNADGTPMFLPQDVAAFDGAMWPVLDHLVKEIFYLNKMSKRPKEEGATGENVEEHPKAEMSINGSR